MGALTGRLVAAAVAIVLIVMGLALRGTFDGPDEDTGSATVDSSSGGDARVLACTDGLDDVCRTVIPDGWDLRIIPADITSSTEVVEPGGQVALWITFGPWDSIRTVDDRTNKRVNTDMPAEGETIAVSPAVTVAWNDRAEVLTSACGTEFWTCVRDHAGERWSSFGGDSRWGQLKVGLASPTSSAFGAAAIANYVGDTLGATTYSASRLRDASVIRAFDSLDSVLRVERSVLSAMITRGAASVDVAVVTEAEAIDAFRQSGDRATQVTMAALAPRSFMAVKLVEIGGQSAGDVRSDLETALIDDGAWRDPKTLQPATNAATLPFLTDVSQYPTDQGLPAVGVIEATRQAWVTTAG